MLPSAKSLESNKLVIFASSDMIILRKLLYAIFFAGFMGILAQVKFFLPDTPVPVTAQVLGALLAGVILGSKFGSLSILIYLAFGINGVPWFSGGTAGVNIFSVGYIIGFIPAALVIGLVYNKIRTQRYFVLAQLIGLMILGILIIYFCGAMWFYFVTGSKLGFGTLVAFTIIKFVPGEVIKLVAAVSIARIFLHLNRLSAVSKKY